MPPQDLSAARDINKLLKGNDIVSAADEACRSMTTPAVAAATTGMITTY